MTIDPIVVTAIMGFLGIGVIGIIQAIKSVLKVDGTVALILSAVVCSAATYFTLKQLAIFNIWTFLLYDIVVFGEATGLYDLFRAESRKT